MIRKDSLGRCALGCLALFVTMVPSQAWAQCNIYLEFSNMDRKVYGPVAAECPGNWPHDPPFGNWGVDSLFGGRYDGFQFAGWKDEDEWQQWNSCTTDWQYSPPSCWYFNWPPGVCTTQVTDVGSYIFDVFTAGPMEWPCSDYGTIYTFSNQFMEMHELDWPGPDALVATAYYPPVNVVLTEGPWGMYRHGWSDWISPSSVSPDVLTAKIQMYAYLAD